MVARPLLLRFSIQPRGYMEKTMTTRESSGQQIAQNVYPLIATDRSGKAAEFISLPNICHHQSPGAVAPRR